MATTRMSDEQYTQVFVELENATELSNAVLARLTAIGNECDARGLEQAMGRRSRRGKSSDQGRRFVRLVNGLNDRFNCRLHKRQDGFEIRPAGSWW